MTTFAAYFDDSGTHAGATAVVCGGWVASIEQWERFDLDWREILSRPEFDLEYLHMKELRTYKGRFERFQDLTLQTDLLRRIHRLLKVRATTFGCVVLIADYQRVDEEFRLREQCGGPHTLAACVTIHKIGEWMKQWHYADDLRLIFGDVNEWAELSEAIQRLYGNRPERGELRASPALQAADHVVWEFHRATGQMIATHFAPRSVKFRGSFDALMEKFGHTVWVHVGEEDLRGLCEGWQLKRRDS